MINSAEMILEAVGDSSPSSFEVVARDRGLLASKARRHVALLIIASKTLALTSYSASPRDSQEAWRRARLPRHVRPLIFCQSEQDNR